MTIASIDRPRPGLHFLAVTFPIHDEVQIGVVGRVGATLGEGGPSLSKGGNSVKSRRTRSLTQYAKGAPGIWRNEVGSTEWTMPGTAFPSRTAATASARTAPFS